jgi:hypothetical protein
MAHDFSLVYSTGDAGVINIIVLFSEASANLDWLVNALAAEGFRVVGVITTEALSTLELSDVSFVVLDVVIDAEPTELLSVLTALRANHHLSHATALVRAERINDLATVAGLCPPYRALICYHEDLIQLVKHHGHHGHHAHLLPEHERKHLF